jgi:hypothetical protein
MPKSIDGLRQGRLGTMARFDRGTSRGCAGIIYCLTCSHCDYTKLLTNIFHSVDDVDTSKKFPNAHIYKLNCPHA